ncbi:hypothetical protein ACLOJK_021257 [Asimina triloba]
MIGTCHAHVDMPACWRREGARGDVVAGKRVVETAWQPIADVGLGGVHADEGGRGSGERRCRWWSAQTCVGVGWWPARWATWIVRSRVVASTMGSLDRLIQASVVAISGQQLDPDVMNGHCKRDGQCRRDDLRRPLCAVSMVSGLARSCGHDVGLDLLMEGSLVARFRFEMGDDRSGMKMNLLMTGEEDFPRVATVINNVLIVAVVMSGLDRGKDGPTVMGLDGGELPFFGDGDETDVVDGRWADGIFDGRLGRMTSASPVGFIGGHSKVAGCRPSHVDGGGAVLHDVYFQALFM